MDDAVRDANYHSGYATPSYRSYVLTALIVIYVFNGIDRLLLSVLQEHIKADLGLSDFQLGLLSGPAFVILYTLSQIPIARMAERFNRITIISIGAAAWSIATATCGLAQNFVQLGLSRIGVGIGEAACVPPSHSTISDYFPSDKRATALGIFSLGIPIGTLAAAIGGSYLAQEYGWRFAFILLGGLGVAAAIALKLTVKEPARAGADVEAPDLSTTLNYLRSKRSLWHAGIGGALAAIVCFSLLSFLVSYLMRQYQLDVSVASRAFAVIAGFGVAIGIFSGGFLVDQISQRVPNAIALIPAVALGLSIPVWLLAFSQSSFLAATVLMFIGAVLSFCNIAPTTAIGQSVAEPKMRATVSAILLTASALIGYGFGPPFVGAIADAVSSQALNAAGIDPSVCLDTPGLAECQAAGAEGLRWGLISILAFAVWASVHYWFASRTIIDDKVN